MAKLAIIWRNPRKVSNQLRYLPQAQTGHRGIYVVQQLLSRERGVWVNSSVLEVISREATSRTEQPAPLWRLGFGR
ncbi:MAG: hypothetical protein JOZ80_11120 [Acidobacteriaceae bacterium]|nr:hypothetical protein [Acidobacteriaceae bacterium]